MGGAFDYNPHATWPAARTFIPGSALSGTTAVRAVNGISRFSNLAVDKAGTYTLQASASGAASVSSTAFSITTVTTP